MKKFFLVLTLSAYVFSNAQNVGIGTNSPTRAKLEVNGAAGSTSAIFGGESTGISLQRDWPGIGFNSYHSSGHRYISNGFGSVFYLDPGSGTMALDMFGNGSTNNTISILNRALIITHDGRMSIGSTTPPPSTLFVARGTGNDGTAAFQGTTYRSHFNYGVAEDTYIRPGKISAKVFLNDVPNGRVIIGNGTNTRVSINNGPDPAYPLEIRQETLSAGNERGLFLVSPYFSFNNWELRTRFSLEFFFNGTAKSYISSASGEFNTFSDARLKKNIQKLPSVLDKVLRLNPVVYEMKDQNPQHKQSVGFVAQEVKELFPQIVEVTKDTISGCTFSGLHSISYSSFGVIAIKAIQEQQMEIEALKKKNEALEARLEKLEKLVSKN